MCKWRRNKEKLKKYVVEPNYYYGKNREGEEEEDYVESEVTLKGPYHLN